MLVIQAVVFSCTDKSEKTDEFATPLPVSPGNDNWGTKAEIRTSTGSGLFALFGRDFEQTFGQIVSIRVKPHGGVKALKEKKCSLPVDVRCSKTLLLKLSNVILLTFYYPDLGNNSDWSCQEENSLQPIRSAAQKWVVTRHQWGVSLIVPQMPPLGNQWSVVLRFHHWFPSGGVAKCRLFSQVMYGSTVYVIFIF